MKIEVFYKDGNYDIFDSSMLTNDNALDSKGYSAVMTKCNIGWDDFLRPNHPSHLNLYFYYYRNNNEHKSSIVNKDYLDKLLFYENDRNIYPGITTEQIKNRSMNLPYGALEPGTWFTIVPIESRHLVESIVVDDELWIQYSDKYDILINMHKLEYFEKEYCGELESKLLRDRILAIFLKMKRSLIEDGNTAIDNNQIAYKIGIPPNLISIMKKEVENNASDLPLKE